MFVQYEALSIVGPRPRDRGRSPLVWLPRSSIHKSSNRRCDRHQLEQPSPISLSDCNIAQWTAALESSTPLTCVRIAISSWHLPRAGQMASSGLQGVRCRSDSPRALCMREARVIVGITAAMGDKKCLRVATPSLPCGCRGNSLAAAQLCPTNGEER